MIYLGLKPQFSLTYISLYSLFSNPHFKYVCELNRTFVCFGSPMEENILFSNDLLIIRQIYSISCL
jgi:hypothetical protein